RALPRPSINSTLLHALGVHPVEGVYTLLLLHTKPSTLVTAGAEIFLHGLADPNIFDLNLIAEFDRGFRCGSAVLFLRQIPFKDRERPLRFERQHDIQ